MIVVGTRGYGRVHLENARRLQAAGRLRIVAMVDHRAGSEHTDREGVRICPDLGVALARSYADVVTIATPLDTHGALAEQAMRAGADVYLEKPPVPTMADFESLLAVQAATGSVVQVGFQSLGSQALHAFATDALDLGPTTAVGATGLWSRTLAYWKRARWVGRRTLDGHPVVDGVATNPLAHAVATALRIAGYDRADSVGAVEVELFHANRIESDDTSVIRISGNGRPTVTCALTLCAPPECASRGDGGATVTVVGERGSAIFSYSTDVVALGSDFERAEHRSFGRVDLLENLLDHRDRGDALLVPLGAVGAFMRVVEAIRLAPPPAMIDNTYVRWREGGTGGDASAAEKREDARYPVVDDIARIVRTASSGGKLFSELEVPWALGRRDHELARASIGPTVVAHEADGRGTAPSSSPHPYLHPVRTLGAVTVTAAHPADHDWHTGAGFAVAGVDAVNFWGGPTYVRGIGYKALDDHGRIDVVESTALDGGVLHLLEWRGPHGAVMLSERRRVRWWALAGDGPVAPSWALEVDVRLAPPEGCDRVVLRSPGSEGRDSAGYGGFFWRLPECVDAEVFTADSRGEDAVNGSRSAWLAWTGRLLAGENDGGRNGEASLVLAPMGEDEPSDPWFVRQRDYPAIGTAVAWDAPVTVTSSGFHRLYRVAVVDGRVSSSQAARLAARLRYPG